jgi:starch phosphorylase
MVVLPGKGLTSRYEGTEYHFCSAFCRDSFLRDPRHLAAGAAVLAESSPAIRRIAYFSMEVGVESAMPTYCGGLGVLAGDFLRSAADLKVPVVAVSLLHRKGYLDQQLDEWGNQHEGPSLWDPARFARQLPATVHVTVEGRPVAVRAWQYDVRGESGYFVPLILLDTDASENDPGQRELTSWLYGGDQRYRLAQEIVLGIGGLRMLKALGYTGLERFHMNEGHAALVALALLEEGRDAWDFNAVRSRCVFTTHTPLPAGHDQFDYGLVRHVLGEGLPPDVLLMLGGSDRLNMTYLALNLSSHVNGVAKKHGEVSREMFPGHAIGSVTNGVHSATWTADSFKALYDRNIPDWARDPASLRLAVSIPRQEIWEAHIRAKKVLLDEIRRRNGATLNPDALTIGFARRAALYKRAELVLSDLAQLADSARTVGPMQVVFAGKAHPGDEGGRALIRRIFEAARQLREAVKVVYLANYDMALAKLLTAGSDLWLNTPLRPLEASGTSGMKAAHNGVPSLSVLDGWWIEGHIEGVTGWSVGSGPGAPAEESGARDAADLYGKLRTVILPTFYHDRERWIDIMRQTIAFNASFFNTHRMIQQYAANAYV